MSLFLSFAPGCDSKAFCLVAFAAATRIYPKVGTGNRSVTQLLASRPRACDNCSLNGCASGIKLAAIFRLRGLRQNHHVIRMESQVEQGFLLQKPSSIRTRRGEAPA